MQILSDVYNRYSYIITKSSLLQTTSVDSLIGILASNRTSIRKRAIPALGALVGNNPALFDLIKPQIAKGLGAGGDSGRIWSMVIASLARGMSVGKIGSLVNEGTIVEPVLKQTEDPEEIDMVEGALVVSPDI